MSIPGSRSKDKVEMPVVLVTENKPNPVVIIIKWAEASRKLYILINSVANSHRTLTVVVDVPNFIAVSSCSQIPGWWYIVTICKWLQVKIFYRFEQGLLLLTRYAVRYERILWSSQTPADPLTGVQGLTDLWRLIVHPVVAAIQLCPQSAVFLAIHGADDLSRGHREARVSAQELALLLHEAATAGGGDAAQQAELQVEAGGAADQGAGGPGVVPPQLAAPLVEGEGLAAGGEVAGLLALRHAADVELSDPQIVVILAIAHSEVLTGAILRGSGARDPSQGSQKDKYWSSLLHSELWWFIKHNRQSLLNPYIVRR